MTEVYNTNKEKGRLRSPSTFRGWGESCPPCPLLLMTENVRTKEPEEQKVWFLMRGHSKDWGEIVWSSYNLVFISLPRHVHMCIWCPWDTTVNKKASILGKWAPVPFWVRSDGHRKSLAFFPQKAWPYTFSCPCPSVIPCPPMQTSCSWCLLAFYHWRMFWLLQTREGTEHSLHAEVVPTVQEPNSTQLPGYELGGGSKLLQGNRGFVKCGPQR